MKEHEQPNFESQMKEVEIHYPNMFRFVGAWIADSSNVEVEEVPNLIDEFVEAEYPAFPEYVKGLQEEIAALLASDTLPWGEIGSEGMVQWTGEEEARRWLEEVGHVLKQRLATLDG